jgi:uncharacterized protein (DUF697 family)
MVQNSQDAAANLSLQTTQLRNDLAGLNHLAEGFGQTLVRSLAGGIIEGRKLSDVLRGVALSLAGQALSSALRPLGTLAGDILGSAIPAANIARGVAGVTVNISTPNAASFQQSQSQVASVIARAVARGQRNL